MNGIKRERKYYKIKISKCSFRQQKKNSTMECKTKKENFMENGEDKNANEKKLKTTSIVENYEVKN